MNVHALQHELFGYALTVFPLLKNFFNIKMPIAMYFIKETKKRKIVRKSLSRIMFIPSSIFLNTILTTIPLSRKEEQSQIKRLIEDSFHIKLYYTSFFVFTYQFFVVFFQIENQRNHKKVHLIQYIKMEPLIFHISEGYYGNFSY